MPDLRWFELFPGRDLSLVDVTAMTRVLAGRPRRGLRQLQPVVAFEIWLSRDQVRWLVGCEADVARHLPSELAAQSPKLSLAAVADSPRRRPLTARDLRLSSMSFPLRLDTAASVAAGVLAVRHRLGKNEQAVVSIVVGPSQRFTQRPSTPTVLEQFGVAQPKRPEASEQRAWVDKLAEPLYGLRFRAGAVAKDRQRAAQIIGPLVSALSLMSAPRARLLAGYQSSRVAEQMFQVLGRRRNWSSLVNASELACLLALPIDGVKIPGKLLELALAPKKLLVPADKPAKADGDRLIGTSLHPRDKGALVRLPARSTTSHVHLIAPTGSGKSVLLARWCTEDAAAGRSLLVIEPKGDLVTDILAQLPASRHNDVVIIEPSADARPVVGLNPLAGPRHDAERRADSMLSLFRAVFGSAIGPRSSDLLLHALIMASRLDDGSLVDVVPILTNDAYRRRVLTDVSDPLIIEPWAAGFDSLSEQERMRVVSPVLNKLRAFLSRAPIRRLIGQGQPRFSLDELFTGPKIVLVSLNAGLIGMEPARLIGAIVLQQCWEAIQRQASVPAAQRRPVMVTIDELADFVGALDFAEVLAKARGMNVSFTVAHQHLRQLNPNLRAALTANARNRVAWRPARDDAKPLADVFGISPDTLLGLPAFHAVAQVLVDHTPSAPFGVKTLPLPEPTNNPEALRHASAARYGVDPQRLDAELLDRWQGGGNSGSGPVGMTPRRAGQ